MKRPDLSPAPWNYSISTGTITDAQHISVCAPFTIPASHAIAALPDLLAALEEAFIHGNKRVTDAAEKALTKAGYTFNDLANS